MKTGKTISRYYKVFKPYGMLSQFTKEGDHPTLSDLGSFPKDVYPVGRLDHDTEGLLLLTNDKRVNHLLLDPKFQHKKTYWAQIEGEMSDASLQELQKGVLINLKAKLHRTKTATVRKISAPKMAERNPPVNYTKHPVTSWIELIITEGKNRQVRKMTAKVGHPTLRLIRFAIEEMTLEKMKSGEVIEIKETEFYPLLKLQRLPERSHRRLSADSPIGKFGERSSVGHENRRPAHGFKGRMPSSRNAARDKR
jgi:23S rRNA pseudouridine2457 synthase